MYDKHIIECFEPRWVISRVKYDPDNDVAITVKETPDFIIEPLLDDSEYECTCGEKFQSYSEAEDHLYDVYKSQTTLDEEL